MSNYTGPPNNHGDAYYGQQGQGYYPPHQEPDRLPQQQYYNPTPQQYNQPPYGEQAATHQGYPASSATYGQQYPQAPQPVNSGTNYQYPQQFSGQDRGHLPYTPNQQYQSNGESASYYGGDMQHQHPPGYAAGPGGPEGDRGLGSTLLGGAAGGFAGHKMGGGFLGTAGGAVLGAVGMNMATHEM
ncbi:hypothetical protein N7507_002839 [Penicillium longicatenatum]|nr:hypothetical protein N7507_002839 [Penicillium longicatenatum]